MGENFIKLKHIFYFPSLVLSIPSILFFLFDNRGTFHGQALRTLHGDPNLRVLTTLQQPTLGKFRVSSVAGFKPRTMCHLLGPHFPVFSPYLLIFFSLLQQVQIQKLWTHLNKDPYGSSQLVKCPIDQRKQHLKSHNQKNEWRNK